MKNISYTLIALFLSIAGLSPQSVEAAEEELLIVVFGASGRIGQVIVLEALERGHNVRGISRDPEKLQTRHRNFSAVQGDLEDAGNIRKLVSGADAVVITISARAPDNRPENSLLVKATRNMQEALEQLETRPYIVQMGGANLMYGTTYEEVKKNMQDAPFTFDEGTEMYAVLFGHQMSVEMYRASDLQWTVVVPPITIKGIYGELDKVTGKNTFRISTRAPLIAKDGSKTIYVRDLARATVDEIEERKYVGQLFSVGY